MDLSQHTSTGIRRRIVQAPEEGSLIVGNVCRTKNYESFKAAPGNRVTKDRKALRKSIAEKGLISPIIVDAEFNVIDGQHRLSICKELGIDVDYIVRKVENDSILDVNTNQLNWKREDYLKRFVDLGNPHYILLLKIMQENDLPAVVAAPLVKGRLSDTVVREDFKAGKFVITEDDLRRFDAQIVQLNEIWNSSNGIFKAKLKATRAMPALAALISHSRYNHKYFVERLNNQVMDHEVKSVATIEQGKRMLEILYNYRLNEKNRIYLD